jgi:hypothetical protein
MQQQEPEPEQKLNTKGSSTNSKHLKKFAKEQKTSSLKQSTMNSLSKLNTRLGVLNLNPRQMLDHLLNRGGALDFADTKEVMAKRDGKWNVSKNSQLYFNKKVIKGLARDGISSDLYE